MAYTINKTNGAVLTTIADGTIDNTTDLTLVGKNYSGYGEILNENLVKLLENFASSSQPSAPLAGQVWWDLTNKLLKVNTDGTAGAWKVISGSTASSTQPSSGTLGDLWFDTVNAQLRVYNGSSWTLIGPTFTAGTGVSGAIVTTIADNVGSNHVIVQFYAGNSIVAILSKDAQFTPQSPISGFSTISPGIQLSTAIAGATFVGTATNADTLDNLNSTQFLRSDANASSSGSLTLLNNSGLTFGTNSDGRLTVAGSDVYISNNTSDGDMFLRVNRSVGGVVAALTIDGATAAVSTASTPAANSNSNVIATTAYVDNPTTGFLKVDGTKRITGVLLPNANATIDLGSSSFRFQDIYASDDIYATNFNGTAVAARYSDLAERFAADAEYDAGTVVELGGAEEITAVVEERSEKVFGVISTRAAYLMNSAAGDNATHPPVAMAGRVPVKVTGKVRKGDRLVSAGNGLARAARSDELTSFNVIGRALESKDSDQVGLVNAVVKIQ